MRKSVTVACAFLALNLIIPEQVSQAYKYQRRSDRLGSMVAGIDYVPGELIVTVGKVVKPTEEQVRLAENRLGIPGLDALFATVGVRHIEKLIRSYDRARSESGDFLERTYVISFDHENDMAGLLAQFEGREDIDYVDVNEITKFELHAAKRFIPDAGTQFSEQWNLDRDVYNSSHPMTPVGPFADIAMPEAWTIERGDRNLVVTVLDTGIMVDTSGTDAGWRLHSDFNYHWIAAEDHRSPGILNGADFDCTFNFSDNDADGVRDNIIGHNLRHGFGCGTIHSGACPSCSDPSYAYNEAFFHGLPMNWILQFDDNGKVSGWDVVGFDQHGTYTSSIAVGRLSGANIVGVAPRCKLYHVRYFNSSTIDAQSVLHAASVAKVINMSWGLSNSPLFEWAITSAANAERCGADRGERRLLVQTESRFVHRHQKDDDAEVVRLPDFSE